MGMWTEYRGMIDSSQVPHSIEDYFISLTPVFNGNGWVHHLVYMYGS